MLKTSLRRQASGLSERCGLQVLLAHFHVSDNGGRMEVDRADPVGHFVKLKERYGGWLAVLSLAMLLAGPAAAEPWSRCSGNGWEVTGANDQEQALVCDGVARAVEFLSSCGVVSPKATRIRVVDVLPHYCGVTAWGLFDTTRDEIILGNPSICVAEAPEGSLFQSIEAPLAFMSIAAHEATHALLYARGLGLDQQLEHEYIAAVVQMHVLPEAARAHVLAPLNLGATVAQWELNLLSLRLNPELFGGLAWRHFETEPDGCEFIRALADGALRLPDFSSF
jgi:hypothetical protein